MMLTDQLPGYIYYPLVTLLSTSLLYITRHWLRNLYRQHITKQPPIVFTWPLIGSAIAFGTEPVKLLRQCTAEYGPVFVLQLGPWTRMTFFTDPQVSGIALHRRLSFTMCRIVAQESTNSVLPASTDTRYSTGAITGGAKHFPFMQ
jgi:hypothetical protein